MGSDVVKVGSGDEKLKSVQNNLLWKVQKNFSNNGYKSRFRYWNVIPRIAM